MVEIELPEDKINRRNSYYNYFDIEGCDMLVGKCNCGATHAIEDWKSAKDYDRLLRIYYIKGILCVRNATYKSRVKFKPGTRIIFTRMMWDGPSDESPGNLYCYEGDGGVVQKEPEYTHRHLVKWDNWIHGHYAEHLTDFVIDPIEYGVQLELDFS